MIEHILMKRESLGIKLKSIILLIVVLIMFTCSTNAQLSVNSIAPDWTLTDIEGNSHTLYDYLDQGKTVVIDFSTTWCSPCWNYHQTHALSDVYNNYGPNGTDEMMVFWIEGDLATDSADLHGTGNSTQGDWVTGTPYPIIDLTETSIIDDYDIVGWPLIYLICPDRIIKFVDIGAVSSSAANLYIRQGNCTFGQFTNDVKIFSTYGPEGTICSSFIPKVKIQNYGSQDLTTMDIISKVDGSVVNTFSWAGSVAQYDMEDITLPEVTITSVANGDHIFTYETANPNGVADEDDTNNIVDKDFFVNSNTTQVELSITPDMFPSDISWYVKYGNVTVFSKGGYTSLDTIITEALCLEEDSCYTFYIYDVHNNGFTLPAGSAIMTWQNSELFSFTEAEHNGPSYSVDFCVKSDGIYKQKPDLPVGVSIFPNPAKDVVKIKFNEVINSKLKITLTNILGEVVNQTKYAGISNEILKLNLSNFQNGIYFISIETYYGILTKKLIVFK